MTYNGFIILDKPLGLSSRGALDRVRRLTQTRQAGYAGTLDPLATGVLVCALGPSTRLLSYLEHDDKRYRATVELGRETDTGDAEGRDVARGDWNAISREAVEAALPAFSGAIRQRPPAFSAISIGGQRLYTLARKGEAVEPPEREVTVHSLSLLEWEPPRLILDIHCSKGTYVRALARDIGRALGCRAYLAGLRRTASGAFTMRQAVTLDELSAAIEGRLQALLLPPVTAVAGFARTILSLSELVDIIHGRRIPQGTAPDGKLAMFSRDGGLVAIGQAAAGVIQPEKVLSRGPAAPLPLASCMPPDPLCQ